MLATNLIGCTICFRRPAKRKGEEPNSLHKTEGTIRVVFVDSKDYVQFLVESQETHTLESTKTHEMIICHDLLFKDAVTQLEREDAER